MNTSHRENLNVVVITGNSIYMATFFLTTMELAHGMEV